MRKRLFGRLLAIGAVALATPALAQGNGFEAQFDNALGTELRTPQTLDAIYSTPLERQLAQLADSSNGRIGVYAIDLSTGREIGVLADQRFPMASTSKVAIAAVFLAGVDEGRWSLTSEFRLPRPGRVYLPAYKHLSLMISKSCNDCTDALLQAVGGPRAVNKWMRDAGIEGFQLTRDIATLIREDGRVDPAWSVDAKDSATPRAMGQLLAGIYQGKWLSDYSRRVLLDAMEETTTGKRRMRSALPASANLAHKTGTLSRTASDIGIFHTPDGRAIAAAIYVTGQSPSMAIENGSRSRKLEARANRDARISNITQALYYGFGPNTDDGRNWASADYGGE
ncbi:MULTISPECIES: serine hydrolase [unclassified Erythrobacter]|uniref:serine hydrolase n=1 Tax=unclassified Erythrobacter TaxID=2633097 RepID=UPI00076D3450|nr:MULTISPECIES: serine hydrolase [unclassified Erythrobacter]KWV93937.1 serine hydrolase [Erythrobacter sp. AP23]MBO6527983.1 serine hydrolase [Erythrobacter sp.]MBO6530365.1 serine hydrolase [Erythrobacter sp.]MBO6767403.1 serine hydrolase [Erythrobacter sp.]